MNKIEIDGKITKIVKSKSPIAKDITGYHILVTTDWRNPFTIFAMVTGDSAGLVEGEEVTVTGTLEKYGDFCISADSICKKETHCKYCGEVIPQGHYCCNSCWKEFEEPYKEE